MRTSALHVAQFQRPLHRNQTSPRQNNAVPLQSRSTATLHLHHPSSPTVNPNSTTITAAVPIMSDTPPPPPPPAFHRPGALRRSPPVIAGGVTGALAKSSSILHNANPPMSSPLGTPVIPNSNGSGTDVGQDNTPTHTTRPKRRRLSKAPLEVQESVASALVTAVGKPQKQSQTSGWERRDRRAVGSETGGSVGKGTAAGNLSLSGARGGDAAEGRRGKKRSQQEPQYEEVLRARIEAIERANEKLRKEVEAERVRVEAQQRQQEQQFQTGEDQDQKYGEEDMMFVSPFLPLLPTSWWKTNISIEPVSSLPTTLLSPPFLPPPPTLNQYGISS